MAQYVTINTKKDQIVIRLSEKAEQEEIIASLKRKLTELKKLYQKEKTPILITGKILKNKEINEIQDLIKKQIDVQIDFESPKVLGLYGIKKVYHQDIQNSETKFHTGSIRSGQRIEFEGSLVIIGDVNSGAEVIAGENIVVLGALRGLAHAGAKGNKEAIIAANKIESAQIRISNLIQEIVKDDEEYNITKTYAYIENDKIVLE